MRTARPLLLIYLLAVAGAAVAAEEKSGYSIFHPTPRATMRDMSTDRPDTTESAYTVDAGHFQVESTLFGWSRDGSTEGMVFADSNFKLGLTNNTDLQFVIPFHERESQRGHRVDSGIGDLQMRLKWNVKGNDDDGIAVALMPFVKFPTASHDLGNDHVEGGIIVPVAVPLTERMGLSAMVELDLVHDAIRGGYEVDILQSVAVGFDLSERWGAFVEFVSVASTRAESSWEGYANAGITFAVTDDLMFDAGASAGVNDPAQDIGLFFGMSWRH